MFSKRTSVLYFIFTPPNDQTITQIIMHRAEPVSNKLVIQKSRDQSYNIHRDKLSNVKSTIDNKPPKVHSHLKNKAKKAQVEKGRTHTLLLLFARALSTCYCSHTCCCRFYINLSNYCLSLFVVNLLCFVAVVIFNCAQQNAWRKYSATTTNC